MGTHLGLGGNDSSPGSEDLPKFSLLSERTNLVEDIPMYAQSAS
jgi:hypothetical protein